MCLSYVESMFFLKIKCEQIMKCGIVRKNLEKQVNFFRVVMYTRRNNKINIDVKKCGLCCMINAKGEKRYEAINIYSAML